MSVDLPSGENGLAACFITWLNRLLLYWHQPVRHQPVIVFYKEVSSQREWFDEFCVCPIRHYQLLVNYLLSELINAMITDKIYTSRTLPESYSQTMSVLEFIMLKRGIISIPDIRSWTV